MATTRHMPPLCHLAVLWLPVLACVVCNAHATTVLCNVTGGVLEACTQGTVLFVQGAHVTQLAPDAVAAATDLKSLYVDA